MILDEKKVAVSGGRPVGDNGRGQKTTLQNNTGIDRQLECADGLRIEAENQWLFGNFEYAAELRREARALMAEVRR